MSHEAAGSPQPGAPAATCASRSGPWRTWPNVDRSLGLGEVTLAAGPVGKEPEPWDSCLSSARSRIDPLARDETGPTVPGTPRQGPHVACHRPSAVSAYCSAGASRRSPRKMCQPGSPPPCASSQALPPLGTSTNSARFPASPWTSQMEAHTFPPWNWEARSARPAIPNRSRSRGIAD
jgi:hypothetical protein